MRTARSSAKRVPLGGQVWETDAGSKTSDKHERSQSEPRGSSAFSQAAIGLLYPSTDTPAMASSVDEENKHHSNSLLHLEKGCWDQGVDSQSKQLCMLSWLIPSLDKVVPVMSKVTVQADKDKVLCVTPLSFSIL